MMKKKLVFFLWILFFLVIFLSMSDSQNVFAQYECGDFDFNCRWDLGACDYPNCCFDPPPDSRCEQIPSCRQSVNCRIFTTPEDCEETRRCESSSLPTSTPVPTAAPESCPGTCRGYDGCLENENYGTNAQHNWCLSQPGESRYCCISKEEVIISVDTAIGPIDVSSPEDFVGSILNFALGIGGGIAILLIIIGGVQVLTSAGNPERVKAGKELITSAVSGLLLIIFAVFLLKLIGKDILGIFP